MRFDKHTKEYILSVVRDTNSTGWYRNKGDYQWHNINSRNHIKAIKDKYPKTNIKHWKKEYAVYRHRDGSTVEIHRFVNTKNQKEEHDVKIKWINFNKEIAKLIAAAREEH